MKITTKILITAGLFLCRSCVQDPVFAEPVNMEIIAQIESSNGADRLAYRLDRHDIGKYQVSRPTLAEYNRAHGTHFIARDLLQDSVCLRVADWDLNGYIPSRLLYNNIADTTANRILSYNSGVHAVVIHKADQAYVMKYRRLEGI